MHHNIFLQKSYSINVKTILKTLFDKSALILTLRIIQHYVQVIIAMQLQFLHATFIENQIKFLTVMTI